MPDIRGEQFLGIGSTAQKLKEKILKQFEKTIYVTKGKTRGDSLVYHSRVTVEDAIRRAGNSKSEYKVKLEILQYF